MNAQLAPSREDWLQQRRTGIGGSDVAAILGLSKWKTPLDVFADKLGLSVDTPDNDAMFWGRTLEPVIRQRYSDLTGRSVFVPAEMLRHQEHTFMVANVDGLTEDRRVFEAKTARTAHDWGEPGTDEVPDAYALQVQHYLVVTGYEVADIAVLIGGSDFRIYHVEADASLQADLIEAEAEFWDRVVSGEAPPPVSFADAQQRYGRAVASGAVQASPAVSETHAKLLSIRAQLKELAAQEEEAKATLMVAIGEAGDTLVGPDGRTLATWKLAKAPKRFNAARFKASHPDLHEAFTDEGEPSRRLLIKE